MLKLEKAVPPPTSSEGAMGCLLPCGFPGPLSLLKKGVELFMPVFPSICHAVGAQYPVPKFAASCLIQLRSLAADILCRNVTMLSWPGERHSVVCSREGSSFRVGGRAGCRLSFGRVFASLWIQNTMAASITEEWSYSHHRYRAHLNIPVHTIPIKGAGLQKVAILEVLSLMEGKSKFSLSLSASVLHGESE